MCKMWLAVLALGLSAGAPSFAQETREAGQDEGARDERPHIQVLKNPYDLASFYRSPGGARGFSYGFDRPDPYGLYSNDSCLAHTLFWPHLRRRDLSPSWTSEFG